MEPVGLALDPSSSYCAMIPPSLFARSRRSGVAIVVVLSILVLLTVVVIAFFTSASTDLASSKNYSDELRVKLLADSAVTLLEGQIQAATAGGTSAAPLAWASQPGLIRTYDATGNLNNVFKLYSSNVLVDSTGNFNPSSDTTFSQEIPTDWNKHPGDFVDLNSPVIFTDHSTTTGYSAHYPIIDGNFLQPVAGTATNGRPLYGYDADNNGNGDGTSDIDGFGVDEPATYNRNNPVAPNNNPVPMPVRWLYQLQNGQLSPRNADGTIPGASKSNPVTGRIAYWTDDDTCKLNINTASEGTFWSRPRAKNGTEVNYSLNVPAQNEFQTFPGHPAKTCLSTVFGSLWPVDKWPTSNTYSKWLPYYDLTPRVTEGATNGSAGGTQPTAGINATGVIYDADRLYTTLDELMFNTQISATGSTRTRQTRNVAQTTTAKGVSYQIPPITPQFLETARFFLTASNRAPEVTLLNTPRLSLWPLQSRTNAQTPKEKLLAFCSTVPIGSTNLYSFQRLTSTAEGSFLSCDSPTLDWSIPRNATLYTYLQQLLKSDVPGLGGNFTAKYGTATNQIITEMVDDIRSGLNTMLVPLPANQSYRYSNAGQVVPLQPDGPGVNTQGFGRFCTITEAAIDFFRCNDNPAEPVQIGAVLILQLFNPSPGMQSLKPDMRIRVRGMNNFTIQDDSGPPSTPVPLNMPADATNIVNVGVGYITAGNLTEYVGMETSFYYDSNGNRPKSMAYGAGAQNYPFFNNPAVGTSSPGNGNLPASSTAFDFNPGNPVEITVEIWSNPDTPVIQSVLLQTLHIQFPPSLKLPVPKVGTRNSTNITGTPASIFGARIGTSDGQAADPLNFANLGGIIDQNDVVRSVVVSVGGPAKGDLRILAGMKDVPANYFGPHPFYDYRSRGGTASLLDPNPAKADFNWQFAHSLRIGDNPGYGGLGWYDYGGFPYAGNFFAPPANGVPRSDKTRKSAYTGSLVAGLPPPNTSVPAYYPEAYPSVAVGVTSALLTGNDSIPYPGDWDTGNGALEDGPYINKPDEGNGLVANTSGRAQATNATAVYYNRSFAADESGVTYSPNREVSSAVMFGSLPTGINPTDTSSAKPWQTLLFCPFPAAAANTTTASFHHPGFGKSSGTSSGGTSAPPSPPYLTIPDHYLLDLFTMPIVEPYALSEPLSSQGKVNMNYQIVPFTYIRRDTGVRAVLKSTRVTAIPSKSVKVLTGRYSLGGYKSATGNMSDQYRYGINADETTGTLRAFEDRFNSGDIFRSASEICSVPLVPVADYPDASSYDSSVPSNPTYANMATFWNACQLTGDNLREEPYSDLYPRLTTKSNTYTIHVRAQTLKKSLLTNQATFVDPADATSGAKDVVTAEYRGSFQIERYVDPNAGAAIPDYANGATTPLSQFYKFHTISTKDF